MILTGKQPNDSLIHSIDMSAFAGFSGENSNPNNYEPLNWILDSGASSHIWSNRNAFKSIRKVNNKHEVVLPDGFVNDIKFMGNITLHSEIDLKDVLYVPDFKYNLLSIGQLTKEVKIEVAFGTNHCYSQDQGTKEVIAIAWLADGLYQVDKTSFSRNVIEKFTKYKLCNALYVNSTNKEVPVDKWHLRLGHASFDSLCHIEDIEIKYNSQMCEICPCAKQHRNNFNKSSIVIKFRFQLLHLDVWGPYNIPYLTGAKYFLTSTDDFNRVTWVILIKCKTEVHQALAIFINMVGK